jgi:hypothetical protein
MLEDEFTVPGFKIIWGVCSGEEYRGDNSGDFVRSSPESRLMIGGLFLKLGVDLVG